MHPPKIVNEEANERFIQLAMKLALDVGSQWIGGYVEYEWNHARHVFEHQECVIKNSRFLEFGCNVGASSIILAHLGATVTAVDVDESFLGLAKINAERYGVADRIRFVYVADTSTMPFESSTFDYISCNSVLEYVHRDQLPLVLRELSRVLKTKGILFITGTSNRLWPKEVHSNRWFTNYIPHRLDSIIFNGESPERGILPNDILTTLPNFLNMDLADHSKNYLQSKKDIGISSLKLYILRIGGISLRLFGLSIGSITPNISLTLQKKD
ncbi:MAG: class I SAM-dependent methyltransferase [Thiohalomonadales bacterium]